MKTWEDAIKCIKNSSAESAVYVGCDSVRSKHRKTKKWSARYSTVIVVHHPRDGCNIFHDTITMPDYDKIKVRMLNEVNCAIQAATAIVDHLGGRKLEIHLDINTDPKHKSAVAVKEAMGWVRGMFGFDPKLKPDSWAGTHVSDHYAREKQVKVP